MPEKQDFLTYKNLSAGKKRKHNILRQYDRQIRHQNGHQSTKKQDDLDIADKVAVSLVHTDDNMSPKDRVIKSSEKSGLYEALDLGAIWLERALSGIIENRPLIF